MSDILWSRSTITATTEHWPEDANLSWQVSIPYREPDLLEPILLYNNAMFDSVAIAVGKVGLLYTQFILNNISAEEYNDRIAALQTAIINA